MIDFETAKSINGRYHGEHFFTKSCLTIINDMIERMTPLRAGKEPVVTDGDMIICVKSDGTVIAEHGHIEESSWNDYPTICTRPMDPYVCAKTLKCQASGGYWVGLKAEDMGRIEYVGKVTKYFWTWGPGGARAHGGLEFPLEVNLWRLTQKSFY